MSERAFEFWRQWLITANVLAGFMGVLVAFWGDTALFEKHNMATRQVFFRGTRAQRTRCGARPTACS